MPPSNFSHFDSDKKIDAAITIEEKEQNTQVPVPVKGALRHPLFTEKKRKKKHIKEIEKEIELDIKLGLNPEDTARKALMKDIDELTHSRDYYEITKKELNQLFKINWIDLFYCKPYNILQKIKLLGQIFMGTTYTKVLGFFSLLSIPLAILGYTVATWTLKNRWDFLFNTLIVIAIVGAIVLIVSWISMAFNFRFEQLGDTQYNQEEGPKRTVTFTTMGVSLDILPLKEAKEIIKIPRGAKLKVAEAVDTKIFDGFVVAFPKFEVKKHKINIKEKIIPRISIDPAICGITTDESGESVRLFMVVCWDRKRDIDKTKKSIKRFLKYKIEP